MNNEQVEPRIVSVGVNPMNSTGYQQPVSVKEALRTLELLVNLYPPESKTVHVERLKPGRTLAEDIETENDIPAMRISKVNGIATTVECNNGTKRRIIGLSTALSPYDATIKPGECVRVTTGEMVPNGADTVVRYDDVASENTNGDIEFRINLTKGDNIRERGSEAKSGDVIMKEGITIDLLAISIFKAIGITEIEVYRRTKVCVVSVGPKKYSENGKPNAHFSRQNLMKLFQEEGFKTIDGGNTNDKFENITEKLRVAANFACVIITTGQVETVQKASEYLNLSMDIQSIAMEPGNYSFSHGSIEEKPVLLCMMPEDKNDAWIGANVFISPLLRTMEGRRPRNSFHFTAKITKPIETCCQMRFVRAITESSNGLLITTPITSEDSLCANSIIKLPENEELGTGSIVVGSLIGSTPI